MKRYPCSVCDGSGWLAPGVNCLRCQGTGAEEVEEDTPDLGDAQRALLVISLFCAAVAAVVLAWLNAS